MPVLCDPVDASMVESCSRGKSYTGAVVDDALNPTGAEDDSDYCPYFQHAVELIGRRWTSSILKVLGAGSMRFGEIRSDVPGLSDRLLTARLSELESEGIVVRSDDGGVRYSLTNKGRELGPVFASIEAWSRAFPSEPHQTPGRLSC